MEAYVGSIVAFAGNYEPDGWKFCNGQALNVQAYQVLFSLISTMYGGDGVSYFNVPDLTQRTIIGLGQGNGLTPRKIGDMGGTQMATLDITNLPAHSHTFSAASENGTLNVPTQNCTLSAIGNTGINFYDSYTDTINPPTLASLHGVTIQNTGTGNSHENVQPYVEINYIICTNGIYPDFE